MVPRRWLLAALIASTLETAVSAMAPSFPAGLTSQPPR
jgi:hypothetical protein